jgi:drug/metabolite transporter (DMT)-like permease
MKKAYFKYLLSVLLFGSNGIVASRILMSSYEIVLLRTFIGSLFLLAVFIFSKPKVSERAGKKDIFYIIISGVSMGASWMFLYEAYANVGVSLATLSYYCGPVFVMALSPFVFGEKISGAKLFGFFAVLCGMFLLNNQELYQKGLSWGLFCGIMSAVTYAFMVIFNKKATGIKGLKNSMYQLFISFITVGLFVLIKQGVHIDISAESIAAILVLGIVNTGIGCYLYFSSISGLPAQTVAICGYLEPVSALALSAVFLHERLTPIQAAGAVLILGGAAFGELYRRRRYKVSS